MYIIKAHIYKKQSECKEYALGSKSLERKEGWILTDSFGYQTYARYAESNICVEH